MTPRPRRNVELKARDPAPRRSLRICGALCAKARGVICQRDTYFAVPSGRLKLRDERPGGACLIAYDRNDDARARESQYHIAPVADAPAVLAALEASLGVRVTVTKHRRLFIWEGVRIHLDDVERLGSFIELEAVAPEDSDLVHEYRLVSHLRKTFEIAPEHLTPDGYADQLLTLQRPPFHTRVDEYR